MHEPERLVERLGIDRQPRQRALLEDRHDLVERRLVGHRDDIGPRHADVVHPHAAQVAEVDHQLARARAAARRRPARRVLVALGGVAAENAREEGRPGRTVRVGVFGQGGAMAPPARRMSRPCLLSGNQRPRGAPSGEYGFATPMLASTFVSIASIASARVVRHVVVAEQVQDAMHHEMRRMVGERDPGRLGLRARRSRSRARCRRGRAAPRPAARRLRHLAGEGRPAQDVGRLRLAAELAVQLGHLRVVAGEQPDLVLVRVAPDRGERRPRRALGRAPRSPPPPSAGPRRPPRQVSGISPGGRSRRRG